MSAAARPRRCPSPTGDIRAFDVRTGKLRWSFHTIPHPGEFGYDTWPKDAWTYTGSANNWAGMAVDPKRGIVYVPTGSAASDFYGADRVGDDLFANTLLALNADTGERIWHFQGVRHDIWDRDFPSPPVAGHREARRQDWSTPWRRPPSRDGFICSIAPPASRCFPSNRAATRPATCPAKWPRRRSCCPTRPAPFARQRLTEDLLTNRTPEAHAWALEEFRKLRSDGQFVPFARGPGDGDLSRLRWRRGMGRSGLRSGDRPACTSTPTTWRGRPASPRTNGGNPPRRTLPDQLRQLPWRRSGRRAAADSRR